MVESVFDQIVSYTGLTSRQVKNTLDLLEDGASIPFIARYRKEKTQSLNEQEIRLIKQASQIFEDLFDRRNFILQKLDEQGVLTNELKTKILGAKDLISLEDLYLPYKKRKRSKADIAIENGLEPLAMKIIQNINIDLNTEINQSTEIKIKGIYKHKERTSHTYKVV